VCLHTVHKIGDGSCFKHKIHSISFRAFKRLVQRVNRATRILPLEAFMEKTAQGKTGITTITFDDAYQGILDEAIPYLIQKQIPATVFVNSSTLHGGILWRDKLRLIYDAGLIKELVNGFSSEYGFTVENFYLKSKQPQYNSATVEEALTAFIEQKGLGEKERIYMNTEELKTLNAERFINLGNHSRHHYLLSSLTKEQQHEEIVGGHVDLQKAGLNVSNTFAAPFGGYHTINADTIEVLEQGGYEGLLLTNGQQQVDWHKMPQATKLFVANRLLPKNP